MTRAPITESDQESGDASDIFDPNKSAHDEAEATDSSVGVPDDIEPPPENPQGKQVNKNIAMRSHCRFCNGYVYRQKTNFQWHLEIHLGKGIQVVNKQKIQEKHRECSLNGKQASHRPISNITSSFLSWRENERHKMNGLLRTSQ